MGRIHACCRPLQSSIFLNFSTSLCTVVILMLVGFYIGSPPSGILQTTFCAIKWLKLFLNRVGTSNNTFNVFHAGRLLFKGGQKNPFQLKYKYRHGVQKNGQTPQTGKLAVLGPKSTSPQRLESRKSSNCSLKDRLPWCEHKSFRTMARTAAKSLSVCGSKLDHAAQLFALKAALSLHYFIILK